MEELRAEEALGRGILEEARERAATIAAAAAREEATTLASAPALAAERIAALEARHARKLARLESDSATSLPLEKGRLWIARAGDILRGAMDGYFAALPGGKAAALIARRLAAAAPALASGGAVRLRIEGLAAEAFGAARAALGGSLTSEDVVAAAGLARGVEAESAGARFSFTLADLRDELLEDRRGEIARAALGAAAGGDRS